MIDQVVLIAQAVGSVAGDYNSGFVTSARSPIVLATNMGKVIKKRDANPIM